MLAAVSAHVRENQLSQSNFVSECIHIGKIVRQISFLISESHIF